jgi:hypothetical protein
MELGLLQVADTHYNNAGPDPVFHFIVDPDPDPAPQQSNENLDHLSIDPPGLHLDPQGIFCELPRLCFEPLKLLHFDFNADPNPAFHSFGGSRSSFQ